MDVLWGALLVIGLIAWYSYAAISAFRKWLKEDWHKDDPDYKQKKWYENEKK